jgi:hypothetical protein
MMNVFNEQMFRTGESYGDTAGGARTASSDHSRLRSDRR